MRKNLCLLMIVVLLAPVNSTLISPASASKSGTPCKTLNGKGWDGDKPIVCKKNTSGKLVWMVFSSSSKTKQTYPLTISLILIGETYPSEHEDAVYICDRGLGSYNDISASTGIEVKDGNSKMLATDSLGSATVIDGLTTPNRGSCAFSTKIKVKKSEFYKITVGSRYEKSFSFAELVKKKWQIELMLGS